MYNRKRKKRVSKEERRSRQREYYHRNKERVKANSKKSLEIRKESIKKYGYSPLELKRIKSETGKYVDEEGILHVRGYTLYHDKKAVFCYNCDKIHSFDLSKTTFLNYENENENCFFNGKSFFVE